MLSTILSVLSESPDLLAAPHSTTTLHRRALAAARDAGVVEHILTPSRGPPLVWQVLSMQNLLPYLSEVCLRFRDLLAEIYVQHGANWHLILYCDGVTPGAVLAPELHRKSIIWYATLLEFGIRLSHQELWFCLASIEVAVAKQLPIAALTRLLVRDMLCGERPLHTAGIILPVGKEGRHEIVRIHYHATLADEEALSAMLGIKGASGITPCAARCWCVDKEKLLDVQRGILSLTARSECIVDITCSRKADILLKTDEDVWDDCDHLVRNVGAPNFSEIETCVGINYHTDGLIFDREIRGPFKPSTSHRFDALHVLFSNGLLGAECMLFLKAAKQHCGKFFGDFRSYADRMAWRSPGTVKPQGVFSVGRERSSDATLKARKR